MAGGTLCPSPETAAPAAALEVPRARGARRLLLPLLGLALILAGNYVTRRHLERWRHVPYFEVSGVTSAGILAKGWRLLLPINIGQDQYCWCTTGSVVVVVLEEALSPRGAFCLLNALLVAVTFAASWSAARSPTFSLTLTLCMAFGTQLHYVYALSSLFAFYLFLAYLEVNLLCAYKLLVRGAGGRRWHVGYAVSLLLMALCHETWLNYCLFLVTAGALLWVFFRRHGPAPSARRYAFILGAAVALALVYVPVRAHLGRQHFRPGAEDELILGYPHAVLAAEDFLSNLATYVYMASTNYLPPPLLPSNSDYLLGPEVIRAEQHGYHAQYTHLVEMHHLFYWRYLAGAALLAFGAGLSTSVARAVRGGSRPWACAAVFLLLVLTGSATHLLIKYRPYMSVPALSYKCLLSTFGVSLLIAFGLAAARARFRTAWAHRTLVGLAWAVILAAAALRPAHLSHLNKKVGLGELADPVKGAIRIWNR